MLHMQTAQLSDADSCLSEANLKIGFELNPYAFRIFKNKVDVLLKIV